MPLVKMFASVSGECWVSLYLFVKVGAWAADVFSSSEDSLYYPFYPTYEE